MAQVGRLVQPGDPAPVRGTYGCTEPGCTGSFLASVKGAPLPPAHHPGALWRLTEAAREAVPPTTPRTPSPHP